MKNKVEAEFLIADRRINNLMESMDLRHSRKWYYSTRKVNFTTDSEINEHFFLNLIEKSKNEKDFWIPVIIHNEIAYCDPEIKEITNGDKTMFIPYIS